MVYDGRPSTGCQTCRRRRVKCDEARPICNQCSRSRRECLGYADKHDLFFRDETVVTEKRAKRAKARQKQGQTPTPKPVNLHHETERAGQVLTPAQSSITECSSPALSICPSIIEPLADLAVNFFFATLISSPRHPCVSRGLFDFLPELYAQTSDTSALSYATKATALAAFGNVAGRKDRTSPLAWRTYGNALSELNAALTDPFLARRNETLMTVLLFCMAESLLITKDNDHHYAPISHIDGAVSLLKLRGTELLQSETSARLFLAVRTHMMIERMQQGKALDEYFYSPITGWQHPVAPALQNPANRLTQYTLLVPALRSRATSLLQQSKTEWNIYAVGMLLHEVRSIDIILSTWPASTPDTWQLTAASHASWSSTGLLPDDYHYDVYPGPLDSYYDIWIASVWNSYRVSRLFLNAIIVRCVTWLANLPQNPADEDPECINATRVIQTMANEICASVPFFLGYDAKGLPTELELESLKDSPECTFAALRTIQPSSLCGYFLLWPLFVARSALPIPLPQRNFLRHRMIATAERFGIAQAKMLVELGDRDCKRPLFSERWDAGVFERTWEHANLYASSGI